MPATSIGQVAEKITMEKFVNIAPDTESVTRISDLGHPLPSALDDALREAREFIGFYSWVSSIELEFLGVEAEGILYIFLFEIVPGQSDMDRWIWVVVGDVPPAYITCENAKNPYEAVDAYILAPWKTGSGPPEKESRLLI